MRLIDAEALKEALQYLKLINYDNSGFSKIHNNAIQTCIEEIDNAPTVKSEKAKESEIIKAYTKGFDTGVETVKNERPQGEWDYEQVAFYGICSNCGVAVTSNLADIFLYEEIGKCPYNTNFCPNCGANMQKGGAV